MAFNQNSIRNHRVVSKNNLESIANANTKTICHCEELQTSYKYIDDGSSLTIDGTKILITGKGGDTRWVSVSGRYGPIDPAVTSSINGSIFIYQLVPDTGNIDSTMAESDTRIESATADDTVTEIIVGVFAYTGNTNIRPNCTVNGQPVIWDTNPDRDPVAYLGTVDLTMNTGTITATHEDGAEHSVIVTGDTKPVISSVVFTGTYPGSQTEYKAIDTVSMSVNTDIPFTAVQVENSGACVLQNLSVSSTTSHSWNANIANRGNPASPVPARVRVQKSTGTWSEWVYTNVGGTTVDHVNLVELNNSYPNVATMSQASISYPGTQEAIKDSESFTVDCVCSNYDTIEYSSPNSQISISNQTYESTKTGLSRSTGDYNVSTNNYRISCTKTSNGANTTRNLTVYIAHTFADITMSEASRLRTGGNDDTSIQNHTITLTSSQQLKSVPTIADCSADGGNWSGLFTGGPTIYTRTLQCHDSNDSVGTYSYNALSATNLSEKETTSYTGDSNYVIGGFVSRNITLSAFANESTFNCAVADYSKCTFTWSAKPLPNKRAFNTTTTPDANSWCMAGTIGTQPSTARILDTAATAASSNETTITIEETI